MPKIKLGANAQGVFSVPVAVPVSVPAKKIYSGLDVVQFIKNDPDNGLSVTDDQLTEMLSDTDLQSKIDAGLVVVEA